MKDKNADPLVLSDERLAKLLADPYATLNVTIEDVHGMARELQSRRSSPLAPSTAEAAGKPLDISKDWCLNMAAKEGA